MMSDTEKKLVDSLKRQITETKKQISQFQKKNRAKDLELGRKTDQTKARVVLSILRLKKQSKDYKEFLEEQEKQLSLEYHNKQIFLIVPNI